MLRLAALLFALLIAIPALAQNVTVIGPVTPGNVPVFNSNTVIKDSGQTPGGAATVFNVKSAPCNATGNGIADDTAAINTCIANFNSAGKGVLYLPAGTYKTTAALTAITANGIIKGDGQTGLSGQLGSAPPNYGGVAALPATLIQETSLTAALFTIQSQTLIFQDLAIQNTSGGTPIVGSTGILVNSATQLTATAPSSGATLTFASVPGTVAAGQGVYDVTSGKSVGTVLSVSSPTVTLTAGASNPVSTNDVVSFGGILYQKVDYQNIQVFGFYIGIDIKVGALWTMNNTAITGPVQYGVRINNTVNSDAGDWSINNTSIYSVGSGAPYSGGAAALRHEGSGGGKIVNFKTNSGAAGAPGFVNGIDVAANGSTVDMFIANSSFENFTGTGINVSGSIPNLTITGVEMETGGTPAHAIAIANTSIVWISGVVTPASQPWSGTPISLTNCTNCYVSGLVGFSAPFSGGSLPDHDGSGGIGGTQYLTNTISGSDFRLNWQGPAGFGADFRVLSDPTATTQVTGFTALNDAGNQAVLQAVGSANTTLPNKALLASNIGLVAVSDNTVTTGGTDDISLRPGGFNQEAMLAQHNGHIAFTGQSQTAPSLTAGCNGAGSSVTGTDTAGTVTGQTAAATTCTLTFGHAFAATPFCVAVGNTSPLTGAITPATGTLVVNFASTANFKWTYQCFGA